MIDAAVKTPLKNSQWSHQKETRKCDEQSQTGSCWWLRLVGPMSEVVNWFALNRCGKARDTLDGVACSSHTGHTDSQYMGGSGRHAARGH